MEKKKISHVPIGRNGKKNCLVMGTSSNPTSNNDAAVFINGPGASLTASEKIARNSRKIYCASYSVHLCFRIATSVSRGFSDVSIAVIDEAGDCLDRSFDRSFRRNRWGIGFGIEVGHWKGSLAFAKVGEREGECVGDIVCRT